MFGNMADWLVKIPTYTPQTHTYINVCLYICVTYKTPLSLKTIQCPELQITQDFFFFLHLRQSFKVWARFRFSYNTDRLSASLKTDKTGVWHWNSSQRIKRIHFACLPKAVTLHSDCDGTLWGDRWYVLFFFFLKCRDSTTMANKQTCKHTKNTSRRWTRCLGRGRCLSRSARYTSRLSYRLFVLKGILWHFDQYSVKCLISLQWIWSCRHRKSVERGTSGMVSFKKHKTARTFNTSLIPVRLCLFSLYKKTNKKARNTKLALNSSFTFTVQIWQRVSCIPPKCPAIPLTNTIIHELSIKIIKKTKPQSRSLLRAEIYCMYHIIIFTKHTL